MIDNTSFFFSSCHSTLLPKLQKDIPSSCRPKALEKCVKKIALDS